MTNEKKLLTLYCQARARRTNQRLTKINQPFQPYGNTVKPQLMENVNNVKFRSAEVVRIAGDDNYTYLVKSNYINKEGKRVYVLECMEEDRPWVSVDEEVIIKTAAVEYFVEVFTTNGYLTTWTGFDTEAEAEEYVRWNCQSRFTCKIFKKETSGNSSWDEFVMGFEGVSVGAHAFHAFEVLGAEEL